MKTSANTPVVLDTNVLVYALDTDAPRMMLPRPYAMRPPRGSFLPPSQLRSCSNTLVMSDSRRHRRIVRYHRYTVLSLFMTMTVGGAAGQ